MLRLVPDSDPILRFVAPELRVNEDLRKLAIEMDALMRRHGGIGIAAPQVGVSARFFVLDTRPAGGYAHGAYVNPQVIETSPEWGRVTEGCLTFPGMFLKVSRPRWIRVRFLDLWGNRQTKVLYHLDAQAFLHELEHLDGKLLTDRNKTQP